MVSEIIALALAEDIGPGDVTTNACVPADRRATGIFLAREALVLAGIEILPLIYNARGGVDELEIHQKDGAELADGALIATVRGSARTLLECERTALNFLQRLC